MRWWIVVAAAVAIAVGGASESPKQNRQSDANEVVASNAAPKLDKKPAPVAVSKPVQPSASVGAPKGAKKLQVTGYDFTSSVWTNWIQAISAALIVMMTYFLWRLSAKQTRILEANARDTAQAVALAKQSADAATDSAKAGAESVRLARTVAEADLRAYVSAQPIFIIAFDAEHLGGGRWQILNSGSTPAHNLRQRGDVAVAPLPFVEGYRLPEFTNNFAAPIVLFPGMEFRCDCTASRLFTPDEINGVRDGSLALCLYGEVLYDDAFGNPHFTRFCTFVGASRDVLEKLTTLYKPDDLTLLFISAPVGNEAS